ncbi:MAG: hypothetical protein ACRD5Z_16775, partial [Bryobacteraceae bacterium]
MTAVSTSAFPLAAAQKLAPHRALLIEIVLCSVPAMTLLSLRQLHAAAYYFFGVLGLLLSYKLISKDAKGTLCLIIGSIPGMMLFRSLVAYSSVEVILA